MISIHISAPSERLAGVTKETLILLRAGSQELWNIHRLNCCAIHCGVLECTGGKRPPAESTRVAAIKSSVARVKALPCRPATVLARIARRDLESIDAGLATQPDAPASQPARAHALARSPRAEARLGLPPPLRAVGRKDRSSRSDPGRHGTARVDQSATVARKGVTAGRRARAGCAEVPNDVGLNRPAQATDVVEGSASGARAEYGAASGQERAFSSCSARP